MQRVLLTGASGLIGKSLMKIFAQNKKYRIYAITTNRAKLEEYDFVNIIEGDLCKEEFRKNIIELIKPNCIIHLAWDQTKKDFRKSNENLKWLNISMDLLYNFIESGGNRFIFAGSSSEYDGMNGTFTEEDDITPISEYGKCKKLFSEFGKTYCENKCSFVSLRYFTIYGEKDSHYFGAIPETVRKLKNNEDVFCNSPYTTRDYIYADDAAQITYDMIENNFEGIVNVATGKPQKMKDIFCTIGRALDKENLVHINEDNKTIKEFNADIRLLNSLNIKKDMLDFKQRINNIIENY